MRKQALGIGLIAIVLLIAMSSKTPRIFGQDAESKDPMVGTWKLNVARSNTFARDGSLVPATRPATRVMAVENGGYNMTTFDDAAPNAARAYFFRTDGKDYPDPHGPGKGELADHWRLTPYVIVRLVKTNGKPTEWNTYAVSTDGNELITTMWDPATPDKHMIQVFERQK